VRIFSSLGKLVTNFYARIKKNQKKSKRIKKHKSAITSGRMRQSDTVKGKECNIPRKPGIYRHVNKSTGKIEYVGQTNNLKKRQQEHARDGKLNLDRQTVRYCESYRSITRDQLCNTEKAHIKKHKPSGNKTVGGNGKR